MALHPRFRGPDACVNSPLKWCFARGWHLATSDKLPSLTAFCNGLSRPSGADPCGLFPAAAKQAKIDDFAGNLVDELAKISVKAQELNNNAMYQDRHFA